MKNENDTDKIQYSGGKAHENWHEGYIAGFAAEGKNYAEKGSAAAMYLIYKG